MPLDIAIGILSAKYLAPFIGLGSSLELYILAIASTLFPDIDMLGQLFPKLRLGRHRGVTHYPLLYIPVFLLFWYFFGEGTAIFIALLVFWHFIHDTFLLGWGVAWLAPFSLRRFRSFPDRDGKILCEPWVSWLPHEEQLMQERYGTQDWVRRYYLTPSYIGILEWGVLIYAILLLAFY